MTSLKSSPVTTHEIINKNTKAKYQENGNKAKKADDIEYSYGMVI